LVLATDWKKSAAKPLRTSRDRPATASLPVPDAAGGLTASPRFSKVWATLAFNTLNATNASGATIFLREGNKFVCVARFGKAPTVGTALRLRGGLFADCIDARQLVVSYEEASSKLQDLPYKQRPSCSSAALVPFELDGRVEGVLAVFSTFPLAFRQTAWDKLSAIAMVIESVLFSVAFSRNGRRFGSPAPAAETASTVEAPPDEPLSPPASYDSDQDFLRHMRSMLPAAARATAGGASAIESDSDTIDAILAKVCGDLEMITGRTSASMPQVTLESMAEPQQAHSGLTFNFDDEQRLSEKSEGSEGNEDSQEGQLPPPERLKPQDKFSPNRDVTGATPRQKHSDRFDLSSLATPEGSPAADHAIDEAQAAADELMRQVGSQVDNDLASNYLSALGDLFAQPAPPQTEPPPPERPSLTRRPPTVPPSPIADAPPESTPPKSPSPRTLRPPEFRQPPIAILPPPDDEEIAPRYPLSPWTIAVIVLFVGLLVAATVWIAWFQAS
jgi:hypothetical protein